MTRQQAEQQLKERRGKAYDPWIVDQFLGLLDKLEEIEAIEQRRALAGERTESGYLVPAQLDVITATTAEEREFNELRRDLPRAGTTAEAADVLFKHLRRVVPASTLALYVPAGEANELLVVACFGMGSSAVAGLRVPIGERISGWVFAHSQTVINSDAALELGPVARTFSVPLRYAAAVPVVDGRVVAVVVVYGTEPFEKDHRRLLENAATLFVSSLSQPVSPQSSSETRPIGGSPTERVH
jgi:hypothetical protein